MKPSVFRVPLLTLSLWLALALPALARGQQQDPGPAAQEAEPIWTLIHGETEQYGQLSIDRIGEVYLEGRKWRKLAASKVDVQTLQGPLFVVGNLQDNLVAKVLTLPELGSEASFLDRPLEPGIGLVYGGRGADGSPFCVFTGLDDDAVFQCFTTSVNVAQVGDFVIREGQILIDWGWPMQQRLQLERIRRPLVHDPASAVLAILDPESRVVAADLARTERAELAARLLAGYGEEQNLLDRVTWMSPLERARKRLLALQSGRSPELGAVLSWAREENLSSLVVTTYQALEARFGVGRRPAPTVFLLLDSPQATNARTVGDDLTTGRPRVVMNLACFPSKELFRMALVHEFLHCLQQDMLGSLPQDPMLIEGVAVYLTGQVFPQAKPHELLMWTPEHYATAQAYQDFAAADFLAARASQQDLSEWFVLRVRPQARAEPEEPRRPRSYPDRTGYFLGYLAARRWHADHPEAPLREMLRLPAGSLFEYLAPRN